MKAAVFLGVIFDIEQKRIELESKNLCRKNIKKALEAEYRTFSRKSAFTCLCCAKPVNMNLTKEEGRPFYFKHINGEECTYSENNKTYDKHNAKYEELRKKDIGLTVFREILEGQLKPFGVKIERGYLYKKKLSFIPDFILKFPFSEEVWAVDYFTSIAQGLTDGSYARHIKQRMDTYKNEGFKVFSFVDDTWLAIDRGTGKGTLLSAEKHIALKNNEDDCWDKFLLDEIPKQTLYFLKNEAGYNNFIIDTKSISYVDIDNRSCKTIRFIELDKSERNFTFYKLSESNIPLDRALSLNSKQNNFLLFQLEEDEIRQAFKKSLLSRWEKSEEEKRRTEELTRREEEEKQRAREAILRQQAQKWQNNEYDIKEIEIDDNALKLEMEQIARKASERPVHMSPEQWEWYKSTGSKFSDINSKSNANQIKQSTPPPPTETAEQRIYRKKREKLKDKLLTYPITGENYLEGERDHWRKCILKWIKAHTKEEDLTVSISKLLAALKKEGITFNQNDKIAQYPIKNFINFYQKELKKDFNIKLNLTFID